MFAKGVKAESAARLQLFTDSSNQLHHEYSYDPELLARYEYFLAWQTAYSLPFYAEFKRLPETEAAINFVVTDLIGAGISERDADLAHVLPIMRTLLPANALHALASAMELNARVLAINLAISRYIFANSDPVSGISERDYCVALRNATTLDECLDLIGLTITLGRSLKRLVRIPMMRITLRAMHRPAHATGFGALQDFLEKAYGTFRDIPDVEQFLDRLSVLMTQVFTRSFREPVENLDSNRCHPAALV
jgi:hypothetical protein